MSLRLFARRAGVAFVGLWAAVTLAFFAVQVIGDPIAAALEGTSASGEDIERVRHELGYDRPVLVQYFSFIGGAVQGDFGNSLTFGTDALDIVLQRLPYTLRLAGVSLALTLVIAVPLGVISARKHGSRIDRVVSAVVGFGQSVPSFVLGPLLILFLAVQLGLFPVSGSRDPLSVVLPALTLAAYPIARVTRVLRACMLEVAGADFVRTARSKGLRSSRVVWRHVFPNALLPVISVIGIEAAEMLAGAVVVENIFGWPGIGSVAKQALVVSDVPLVLAVVAIVGAGVAVVNLTVDTIHMLIDPRVARR